MRRLPHIVNRIPRLLISALFVLMLVGPVDLNANDVTGLHVLKALGDLDHDGQPDLAGIRDAADNTSELITYEVDPDGALDVSWRFPLPENLVGRWIDLTVSDLNLNGRPEILAITRVISASGSSSAPWLYGFEWSSGAFPYIPTFQWGLKPEGGLFSRPSQIESADLDNDGLSEVVVSLTSPQPRILILEFSGELAAPVINTEYSALPDEIASTPSPFTLAAHDVNGDGTPDVAVFQKRGSTLHIAQISATGEDSYTTIQQAALPLPSSAPEIIKPAAIGFADLDQSGRTTTFIGTSTGNVYMHDFSDGSVKPVAAPLWQKFPGPVHELKFEDHDSDGLSEVFLRTGGNAFYLEQERGGSTEFANFNSLLEEEVFNADLVLPVNGHLLVNSMNEFSLKPTSMAAGHVEPEPAFEEESMTEDLPSDLSVEDETAGTLAEERLAELQSEEVEEPVKPSYRKPRPADVILHVGEVFTHIIPRQDEMDPGMASVDFRNYPEGMRLGKNFTLRWTPADYQLGYHTVSYTFGNEIDTTFSVYVNDVPVIYSSPPLLAQTGDQYLYQLQLEDMNAEKYFGFELSVAPTGMQIDETGLVRWLPSDTQLDSQYVTISVSDGFEAVTQKFALYVNIPPVILEKPAPVAFVTEEYVGQVKIEDKNAFANARVIGVRVPSGLVLESSGRVSWTPEKDQTGFHDIIFELTDDMAASLDSFTLFANTPPDIISKFDRHVPVGKPWHYNVEVEDPNSNQDISFLLSESSIPNLSISRRGRITWTPTEADLGPQSFTISVSDGLRDDLQKVSLYVNSPPQIGIIEDTLATVARPYSTSVPITDLNKGQPLSYAFLDAPKGMVINKSGVISWTPRKGQQGWAEVFVKVSDEFSSDTYQYKVYANAPPVIVSKPDSMAIAGKEFVYELRAMDLNTDQDLIFKVFDAPEGVTLTEGSTVRWTPGIDQINKRQFKISVTDGYVTHTQSVELFVNALPEVTSEPKPVVLTDREYRYQLSARDLNEDEVAYKKVMLPSGAEMDEALGLITWVPDAANEGENRFIIELIDARGGSSLHDFQVNVFRDPKTPMRQMGAFLITLAGIGAMFIIKFLY